ncbi:alpha/beta fold hydrolase [Microbacterium caowuchunii]|uniref:alpha/beta fold hydrolase n=1 Tax=Microbacterium caowuchunii TaxID=2614638 RepID=UPI001243D5B7|nr:alpha/beta hydrolase [Microbacterium caowuchunii]QEW01267.1 alpha/beta fold hydrolase [Microbacterium caowuchunii]
MSTIDAGEIPGQFVQTRDWRIHYREAGSGHPIVLLHGSGPGATGWNNFRPNIAHLAQKFRVIAVDMPGWGKSDPVTADERNHVKAAIQLLDALDIDRAAFVGNSMGGVTSVQLSARHPERVSHLITMGSGAGGPSLLGPAGPSEGLKILQQAYRDPSPDGMRALVDIMTHDPAFATEELVQARSAAARENPQHLENFIAGMRRPRYTPDWDALVASRVPTLALHGRDDRVVHFEASLRLVQLIPDARLVLMNRCGHWLQLEHAAEFNRLVEGFVSSH